LRIHNPPFISIFGAFLYLYNMTTKIKSTSFFPPYDSKGNCNLKSTGRGVYLIKKNDAVVYVGQSFTDVKKTLYRHFQMWNDLRTTYTKKLQNYERVTYYGQDRTKFKIKVIFCKTITDTANLEFLLIKKYRPKDNTNKMIDLFTKGLDSTVENLNNAGAWQPLNEETPF